MDDGFKLLTTEEEALAAGITPEEFNPEVHLYSVTNTYSTNPVTVTEIVQDINTAPPEVINEEIGNV